MGYRCGIEKCFGGRVAENTVFFCVICDIFGCGDVGIVLLEVDYVGVRGVFL